ncbi:MULTISPECIES: sorbosone dehydrogenase family protein [unclassified Meiothermus]|uniref:PQQ-dependent sugar dehydrogenase n=1 Tax=unclassified Meiothermus TaxID=370471 RepID=UPI000D7BBE63|nr:MULTISPECIES: PQQ-dependent sugar dehydrogenase [unclassified Meiothermus]PZA06641.1 glucose dehydrogenase [Meiothermus sp. Pnk-1]RYM30252.1 glucose dehydrogenase [Meiothermus sp. PNK-Is4]
MRQLLLVLSLLGTAQAQLLSFTPVVRGLQQPLWLTYAPGDGSRMFVLEQAGRVRLVQEGRLLPEPFLDVSDLVSCCGERGLLGLAFHPDYRQNGWFFINYTRRADGATVIARYKVSNNPDRADPRSAQILLTIEQPYANHNGGMVAFGPDGYLYIGVGDGGAAGDPQNHAQNLGSLLGKILRIDVSKSEGNRPYGIPQSNPFLNRPGARPEIWAYGLRNPWRFSFDRESGDLWIGDVGQGRVEEVDFQPAASKGGENYGWRLKEGRQCYTPSSGCAREGLVDPVLEYDHSQGNSITGGYRYRGRAMPALKGAYIYGDFGSGRIWAGREQAGKWTAQLLAHTEYNISSFGEDLEGELYVVDYRGAIYRLGSR